MTNHTAHIDLLLQSYAGIRVAGRCPAATYHEVNVLDER